MTLLLTARADTPAHRCPKCYMGWDDHYLGHGIYGVLCPYKRGQFKSRPLVGGRKYHDCKTPKWSYCDSGEVLCDSCGGWARVGKLPQRVLDDPIDDHFSNYTGWDAGYDPDPPPSLWQGHPWKE